MNDSIPGFYYGAQLTKTKKPSESDHQLVEKVISTKTVGGEKYYLLKFLFYPGW